MDAADMSGIDLLARLLMRYGLTEGMRAKLAAMDDEVIRLLWARHDMLRPQVERLVDPERLERLRMGERPATMPGMAL